MSSHTPKWTPTFSKRNLKNQNSLDWKVFYTIGMLLRLRCLKWVRMIHLNIDDISYSWKKGRESKCQFDFWPLKVKNRPELHVCRWIATYLWNFFDKGYNFALDFISIKGLHKKLRASEIVRVLISRILRLLTCKSQEKWHLGVAPMANHRE
jgi:hypothetical protein